MSTTKSISNASKCPGSLKLLNSVSTRSWISTPKTTENSTCLWGMKRTNRCQLKWISSTTADFSVKLTICNTMNTEMRSTSRRWTTATILLRNCNRITIRPKSEIIWFKSKIRIRIMMQLALAIHRRGKTKKLKWQIVQIRSGLMFLLLIRRANTKFIQSKLRRKKMPRRRREKKIGRKPSKTYLWRSKS